MLLDHSVKIFSRSRRSEKDASRDIFDVLARQTQATVAEFAVTFAPNLGGWFGYKRVRQQGG
ncbi:hypothetical protein XHV734_3304 [Xanthomonas hortorum pv. vitians]|nr:hypothetical protein XHV734_3304 [Xanthomonas hortorum pv. vitians]